MRYRLTDTHRGLVLRHAVQRAILDRLAKRMNAVEAGHRYITEARFVVIDALQKTVTQSAFIL